MYITNLTHTCTCVFICFFLAASLKYSVHSQFKYLNISPNVRHLQIITEYLDLLNIKIQSTHLNHIPVGPL